jgi:hypothetical protein
MEFTRSQVRIYLDSGDDDYPGFTASRFQCFANPTDTVMVGNSYYFKTSCPGKVYQHSRV